MKFWQGDSWQRLLTISDDLTIARGAIMRLPAKWPFEPIVDFMYVDAPNEVDGVFGGGLLVCVTGYKAGLRELALPHVAVNSSPHGIKAKWLKENWEEWVYADCSVEDVWAINHYPAPDMFPTR